MCDELCESTSMWKDLGAFRLHGTMTQSETSVLPRLVNSHWLQLWLNSYILYEFVIGKAHCVHQGHIGTYVSSPEIAYNRKSFI